MKQDETDVSSCNHRVIIISFFWHFMWCGKSVAHSGSIYIFLALRPFTRSTVVMMHALEPFPTFPWINTSSLPSHVLPFYDTASDVTRHKPVRRMITFKRPIKHLLLKQKFSSGDSNGSMCWVNQMIYTLTVLCCQNLVTAPVRWKAWRGWGFKIRL